jgi:hypothetical protein
VARFSYRHLLFVMAALIPSMVVAATAVADWVTPVNLSGGGSPTLAIDGSGDATVLWVRASGPDETLVQSAYRPAGGSWQEPTTVSNAPSIEPEPKLRLDAAGDATAVWEATGGAEGRRELESAYRPAGGSWQQPVAVAEAHQSTHLEVDAAGDAFLIWTQANTIESSYRPSGGSWSVPVALSQAGGDSFAPRIAVDAAGDATAVWTTRNGSESETETSYRPAGGAWEAPSTLSNPGEEAADASLAADPRGDTVVGWARDETPGQNLMIARYRPAGGGWEAPVGLGYEDGEAGSPGLAMDDAGDLMAVWSSVRVSPPRYATVQSAYRPVGGSWEAPVVLSSTESNAYPEDIAFDGLGDALVLWVQGNGEAQAIAGALRTAAGIWQPPTEISEPALLTDNASAAFEPDGSALAVWNGAGFVEAAEDWLTPESPSSVTGAARAARRSATLTATVNPNGWNLTGCRFEYGKSAGYGHRVLCASVPKTSREPAAVSAKISGLEPDTLYYYRVVAENKFGSSEGSGASFNTISRKVHR